MPLSWLCSAGFETAVLVGSSLVTPKGSEREKVLRTQIAAWQEARVFEKYVTELEYSHGDDPDASEWIAWVRSFVANLNPLSHAARMPELNEPKP
jgi:hypothetical protein